MARLSRNGSHIYSPCKIRGMRAMGVASLAAPGNLLWFDRSAFSGDQLPAAENPDEENPFAGAHIGESVISTDRPRAVPRFRAFGRPEINVGRTADSFRDRRSSFSDVELPFAPHALRAAAPQVATSPRRLPQLFNFADRPADPRAGRRIKCGGARHVNQFP